MSYWIWNHIHELFCSLLHWPVYTLNVFFMHYFCNITICYLEHIGSFFYVDFPNVQWKTLLYTYEKMSYYKRIMYQYYWKNYVTSWTLWKYLREPQRPTLLEPSCWMALFFSIEFKFICCPFYTFRYLTITILTFWFTMYAFSHFRIFANFYSGFTKLLV